MHACGFTQSASEIKRQEVDEAKINYSANKNDIAVRNLLYDMLISWS
jgi:hypothetical protein